MKRATIVEELGTPAAELIDETEYAMKQAGTIGTVIDSGLGYIRMTHDESAEVQSFIRRLLELRLATLEGRA